MRIAETIERLLGLQGFRVKGLRIEEVDGRQELTVEIRRRRRRRICSGCGKWVRGTYDRHARRWRHLSMFGTRTYLEGEIRRVNCPRCGVRVEAVAWARRDSAFTRPFEEAVAWLTRRSTQTAVAEWFGIAWETVGNIVEHVVTESLSESRLEGLAAIGVDEFHYGAGHQKVLTLVVDHATGRLIWGGEGQGKETLGRFFALLGQARSASIRLVSLDMDAGYIGAVREHLPQAEIAYDPFHVTRLVLKALDEVRRSEVRESPLDKLRAIKGLRFALRKNPWNLKHGEAKRLEDLQTVNRRLYRAYLLKESLLQVYHYVSPGWAQRQLTKTIGWAVRSRLSPFRKLGRTLRKHLDGVLTFVRYGISNARLEATCRHFRMLSTRAYGFHSAQALLALGFLFCGGINVELPW